MELSLIKSAARGKWPELLSRLGGIDPELLDGKGHPCLKCGGIDRFVAFHDFEATGGVMCRQCFDKNNGDGIAAIMWLTDTGFPETIKLLAAELGISDDSGGPVAVDPVQAMAWRKGVTVDSLVAYGATNETRGTVSVCRVPMHDADMNVVGHFDMAPTMDDLDKGKTTQGSNHGLFVAEPPKPGELVCIVEGVKDAAALHGLVIYAVGLPTSNMAADFARFFRGTHAVIIPDRDKAGIEGAKKTAARLYGVAESVKIAELPADYKETKGDDVRDVLRKRDGEKKVRDAIKNAKPWRDIPVGREIIILSMAEAIDKFIDTIGEKSNLIETGIPYLDNAIGGGMAPGEMMILAGRPSHGKTMVGLQMLDHMAETIPVLMISEEMSIVSLAQRAVSSITTVPSDDWPTHKDAIRSETEYHLSKRKPYLVVESCGTVDRTVEAIIKAKEEYNIGIAAVDYLQMLRGGKGSRYEQVSEVSLKLKQAAMQHNIGIIAISQMNRGVETRNTTSPKMSDLRESGQIEQDSDIIVFVEWLNRSSPDKYDKTEYRIVIAKNRNRPIHQNIISCSFIAERQRLFMPSSATPPANTYKEFTSYAETQHEIF